MSFTSLVATMGNIITKHDNDTRVDVANHIFIEQILISLRRRADDIDERCKSYYTRYGLHCHGGKIVETTLYLAQRVSRIWANIDEYRGYSSKASNCYRISVREKAPAILPRLFCKLFDYAKQVAPLN